MALGLGASKSKSKSTSDTTATSTPTNPEWVTQGAQGLSGQLMGLAGQDPSQFVAGPSALQQQGFDTFSGLGQQAGGWLGQAANMAGNPMMVTGAGLGDASQATASTAAQNMGQYFNPYTQQVTNSAISDMDRARQLTQNGNGQGANLAGGYGGSRQGVMDANADSEFIRNVGSVSGNLNAQGFNTAAGLGAGDAALQTGVSQFNAGQTNQMALNEAQLGQQAQMANQSAGLQGASLMGQLGQYGTSGLMDAGATQQGIMQNQAGAPINVLSQLMSSYGQLPLNLFQGNTSVSNTKGTGSQFGLSAAGTYGK